MSVRRIVAAAVGAGALLASVPTAAHADRPGASLKRSYDRAYDRAEKAGHEPGRNIVEDGVRAKGDVRPATAREVRRSLAVLERMAGAPASGASAGGTASAGLEAIAACESGGDPAAVDASGTYRGKYQFDYGTWQSVGGTGDPAAASEAEQDARAQALMAQRGSAAWPVCGG